VEDKFITMLANFKTNGYTNFTTCGGNLVVATTNLFPLVVKSEDCYATSEQFDVDYRCAS
jgi:hypothetical protein